MDRLTWKDLPTEAAYARQFLKPIEDRELAYQERLTDILETVMFNNIPLARLFNVMRGMLIEAYPKFLDSKLPHEVVHFLFGSMLMIGYELGFDEMYVNLVTDYLFNIHAVNPEHSSYEEAKQVVRHSLTAGFNSHDANFSFLEE